MLVQFLSAQFIAVTPGVSPISSTEERDVSHISVAVSVRSLLDVLWSSPAERVARSLTGEDGRQEIVQ